MYKNMINVNKVLPVNGILAMLFICAAASALVAESGAPPSASSLFLSPAPAPVPESDDAAAEPEPDLADDDEPEPVQEVAAPAPAPAPEPAPVPEPVFESAPETEVAVEPAKEKKEKKEKLKKEKPVKEKPAKIKSDQETERLNDYEFYGNPVKFGARLAYNNTYVPKYSVTTDEIYMPAAAFRRKTYSNSMGLGTSGFEFGAAVDIRLAGSLSLNAGLNFAYRNPVSMEVLDIGEFALGVPVLARCIVGPVFWDIGVQADIPFGTQFKWDGGEKIDAEDRSAVDVGAVLGFGYRIIPGLSLDIRGIIGVMSFDSGGGGEKSQPIYQASVGISYLY